MRVLYFDIDGTLLADHGGLPKTRQEALLQHYASFRRELFFLAPPPFVAPE